MAPAKRARSGQPKGKFTAKMEKPQKATEKQKKTKEEQQEEEEQQEMQETTITAAAAASDESEGEGEDVSDSDSEEENQNDSEEEESDYDELVRASKRSNKKRTTADAEEFASVLTSILGQDARDEKAPIMAKDQTRANQIKEEKLSYRAQKALVHEKRMQLSKDRVIPTMENFDYEKKLRKLATKGVIKLFNVVKAQQTELSEITSTPSTRSEKVADMSKNKFLDLLKAKTSTRPSASN
ncbi:hypothetical protein GGI12_002770 [Dipsacomyces acuminosporus]|nr:hypothetical protein GGI12_002770 [Dipsacomyces acuminosporus]